MTTDGHMPTPDGPNWFVRILIGLLTVVGIVVGLAVLAGLLFLGSCILNQ